jgi:hypothetical protein
MDKEPTPMPFLRSKCHQRPPCVETETKRLQIAMEKLIKYVKEIGFFDGI